MLAAWFSHTWHTLWHEWVALRKIVWLMWRPPCFSKHGPQFPEKFGPEEPIFLKRGRGRERRKGRGGRKGVEGEGEGRERGVEGEREWRGKGRGGGTGRERRGRAGCTHNKFQLCWEIVFGVGTLQNTMQHYIAPFCRTNKCHAPKFCGENFRK